MDVIPQILFSKVMHKRLTPKINAFTYGIYYIACPLSHLELMNNGLLFGVECPALLTFHKKDHGPRDGSDLQIWIQKILQDHCSFSAELSDITLITMPRVLGYVFNPVSFWMCRDTFGQLRAVLCEVNNTFGESHSYLCMRADGCTIRQDEWLQGEKFFHVSPFITREGTYRFRFADNDRGFGVWIDHAGADGQPLLLTALTGKYQTMNRQSLIRAFFFYPLVTLKAIFLIHYQATKLFIKGIRYVRKPQQKAERLSKTIKH